MTEWHDYRLLWETNKCRFEVDGREVLRTSVSPPAPLGLVLWIDNQYARWTREGRIGYGVLANPAAWMEITGLEIN